MANSEKNAALDLSMERFMAEIRTKLGLLQAEVQIIHDGLTTLVANFKIATSEWMNVEEFSRLVDRSKFTVRQWCNLRRISALKNAQDNWVISRAELERYRREGLLPLKDAYRHIR